MAFAGKTDWDQVVALAKAALRSLGRGPDHPPGRAAPRDRVIPGDPPGRGPAADRDRRRRRPSLESGDRYAAQLLATVLGDHTGSRLYWTLIDPGFADGVEVSYQDYNQAGALFTFLSCDPGETQANLGRIREVYQAATTEGITEEELTQAKNKVLARSVLRSERPMGRLASLGFHWTYRREYLSVAQELEAFSRVTLDDLRRVLEGVAAAADDHCFRGTNDGRSRSGVIVTGIRGRVRGCSLGHILVGPPPSPSVSRGRNSRGRPLSHFPMVGGFPSCGS